MNNYFHNNSDIFVRNFQILFKPCESKGVIWVPMGLTYCDVPGNWSFTVNSTEPNRSRSISRYSFNHT